MASVQRNTDPTIESSGASDRHRNILRLLSAHVTVTQLMTSRTDLYHGLFRWERLANGTAQLFQHSEGPTSIPDPQSGRLLRVATVDAHARGFARHVLGHGGYVSFVQDLRLGYACPSCEQLMWINGA